MPQEPVAGNAILLAAHRQGRDERIEQDGEGRHGQEESER